MIALVTVFTSIPNFDENYCMVLVIYLMSVLAGFLLSLSCFLTEPGIIPKNC